MSANVTIANTYDDGVTLNLTNRARDLLAAVLGEVVDQTNDEVSDEVYNLLVGLGADDEAFTVNAGTVTVTDGF